MKKSLLIKLSTLVLSICSLLCIGTACKEEHTHSYTETVTAPTCTEQGFTTHTCSCGDSYVDDYVSALGHEFTNYVSDNNATCTENGTETATCSRENCNESDTRTDENSALDHEYGQAAYTWNGNQCTATRICGRDHTHEETETVIAAYIKDTEATCTTAETGHYKATFNNSAFTEQNTAKDSVENGCALNHSYGVPTYTWNGNQCTAKRICGRDHTHQETETVTAVYEKDTDVTCNEPEKGHYVATFTNSGFTSQKTAKNTVDNGEKLGHQFSNYISDNNATCTENGTETATCNHTGCQESDTRTKENSMLTHTYNKEVVEEKYLKDEATCTSKATYYKSCVCGETGTEYFEYGEANGHSFNATWSYNDTHHWHVSDCGHTEETKDKAEHNYGEGNTCDCGYVNTTCYTVIWKNYDGSILETDESVSFSTMPTYNGNIPTKERDAQYTYTFDGWTPTISRVTDNIVYTAQYSKTVNKYTVVWKNYDGDVLEMDENVAYGTTPAYDGQTPTKQGDAQYGYVFAGWTPAVFEVTGDVEYIATFTQSINKYTITWKNFDGTVLETDKNVSYGTMPTYDGVSPTKPYDSLNEYTFVGWTPTIVSVTGETTYTAIFSIAECDTYVIKYDANGGTGAPDSQTKNKGQSVTLSSTIPSKSGYVFKGWSCAYDGNTYSKGSSFSVDANVTLYAVWWDGCTTCGADGTESVSTPCSSCNGSGTLSSTWKTCSSCGGSGNASSSTTTCLACDGTGKMLRVCPGCSGYGCSYCNSSGTVRDQTCTICSGSGSVSGSSTCSSCGGAGGYYATKICSYCYGLGKTYRDKTCSDCNGSGALKSTPKSYIATLKNGNTTFTTQTVYYGQPFTLNIPTKTGYTFVGWFDAQENGTQHTDRNGISLKVWDEKSNKTLYAQWIENYNITYNLDGGNAENLTVYNIETPTYILVNPTKKGHTFLGWTGSNGETPELTVKIQAGSQGNLNYTANWSINQYTLSFVSQNGQSFDDITQDYGTTLALPKPTWTERSFVGWFDETLTTPFTSETMPAESVTLYAKWVNYEVTLVVGDIVGISINDDLTDGSAYGVTAFDTDGNPVSVKAQLLSGSQTAGTSITVRFVATGLYGVYAMQMVSDIKVYGMPTITYDEEKDYINASDSLVASLFAATATDTYGETLSVNVSIKETEYTTGDTVTIVLSATDVVGNTTVIEIENVKYYGTPTIVRDETVTEIKASDTISSELFNVTATDSFGENLTVTTGIYNGTFAGGYTITVKSSATDSKGNTAYITCQVKVYGAPTITSATKTDFKEGEEITLSSLGIVAKDSFEKALENVTLSLTDGTNTAGNTLTYLVTATDHLGNVNTRTINVKVYGTPTITYNLTKTAIKATDEISASLLSATAKDSFGNALSVTATLESGEIKGGSCITVKLSATDVVGNTYSLVTGEIKVYAQEDIILTYNAALSNNIKKTSCGEEFNAVATDSFGEACTISVVPADGYSLTGGTTISLYLVATDKAGNIYTSDILTEKNVYDTPTLTYAREYDYIFVNDNPYLLFNVKDSFGAERLFDIEIVSGSLQELGTIVYHITAQDKMGNTLDCTYALSVVETRKDGFVIDEYENMQILVDYTSANEIVIPDGVQVIAKGLFVNDTNITSLVLPDSIVQLDEGTFSGCSSLTSITLPFVGALSGKTASDTYQYPLGYIFGTSSYAGGTETEQYYFGSSTSSLTDSIYYIPTCLKSVTITGGNILYGMFRNCALLTSITIGNSVTSIGDCAFYGCSSLTNITIPDSVTSIGHSAFYNCSSLEYTIKDGLKYLGNLNNPYVYLADTETTSITTATIAEGCKVIGYRAFYNCNSLTSVVIPDSVTSIGDEAFYNCSSLEYTIKDGLKYLGNLNNPYVYLADTETTSITTATIAEGCKVIGYRAFYNCSSLTSVVIPDSVTSIGEEVFENCDSLTSVVIGNGVTSIGYSAFRYCYNLTSVVIPDSVTSIGKEAFSYCSRLTSVYYKGTTSDWSNISIKSYNTNLINATRYYYSENQPTTTGNYWHYDENGNIAVW